MVGLQALADVAQLVERRLPKPREPRWGVIGAGAFSPVIADGLQGLSARSPAFPGVPVSACARRSGVLVASRTQPKEDLMHPSTEAILKFFEYDHLPQHLQDVSRPFNSLAWDMAGRFEGAELTTGLRKLLEAKDCMVRAAL
jgi:hypothetical protein